MAVQLGERRKEFAVLRALGLTRWQLSRLIVVESVLIGLLAALIAIPVGLLMAWGADRRHPVAGVRLEYAVSGQRLTALVVPGARYRCCLPGRALSPWRASVDDRRRSCARPEHVASLPDADC